MPHQEQAGMRGASGFTLLEVLIAFAIAALALTALTQAADAGLRSSRVAAQTEDALSRAQSRLAAAAVRPSPGDQQGQDGGFAWHVSVQPEAVGAGRGAAGPLVLYVIRVEVSWAAGEGRRRVGLETLRLGAGSGAP